METNDPVYIAEEEREGGFYVQYIHGLNVFVANDVVTQAQDDPRVVFLESIMCSQPVITHFGAHGLYELADSVGELLLVNTKWLNTRWTISGSNLYPLSAKDQPAVLVPGTVCPGRDIRPESLLELVRSDSLALYIASDIASLSFMTTEDPNRLLSSDEILRKLLEICECLIFTEADGWWFKICSSNRICNPHLDEAVRRALSSIKDSEWYRLNVGRLTWRQEPDFCLVVDRN